MSTEIEHLWGRLKSAAERCAERGNDLTEHDAIELVLTTARAMKISERLPEAAVQFYASEILAIIQLRLDSWPTPTV